MDDPTYYKLVFIWGRCGCESYYYYYYYLIKFNVRIEPLGYGRLIIHVFVTLVAPLHSSNSPMFNDQSQSAAKLGRRMFSALGNDMAIYAVPR